MEEWFKSWFDSPYYNLLYRHRNTDEAALFIDHLLRPLHLAPSAAVLDAPCGYGRHSVYLHQLGFKVVGIDLSRSKIAQAQQHQAEGLSFQVADMRRLEFTEAFDAVLNLFTSFGYFKDQTENLEVLTQFYEALKPGGKLVIDFLNAHYVEATLQPHYDVEVEGVHFEIKKRIEDGHVLKAIRIKDHERMYHFTEDVQLIKAAEFERMLRKTGFTLQEMWGDYTGAPYEPDTSERLILFAQRD